MEGFVWKLNMRYGLNDASRTWYFSMRDELVKLGVKPSLYALFYWYYDNQIQGLIGTNVDDLFWGGTELF